MRDQASVVIIGAGIVGCSAAYQLAQLGWRDIVVLDKGALGENDGSTSHAPGGMFLTNSSKMMTEMAKYSREFYGQLDHVDGQPVLFGTGGLEVAIPKSAGATCGASRAGPKPTACPPSCSRRTKPSSWSRFSIRM